MKAKSLKYFGKCYCGCEVGGLTEESVEHDGYGAWTDCPLADCRYAIMVSPRRPIVVDAFQGTPQALQARQIIAEGYTSGEQS